LHVRFTATYTAPIRGWFTQDETLIILDDSGAWWKVHGGGVDAYGHKTHMTGFVNSDYLAETECP